jgi:hypothetical protein
MKKLILLSVVLYSCETPQQITPQQQNKIGCECNDGNYVVWNENIMRQTGWTTGNPCEGKGGIKKYIYN